MGTRRQLVCDYCGEDIDEEEDNFLEVNRNHGKNEYGYILHSIAGQEKWAYHAECWSEMLRRLDLAERLEDDRLRWNITATKQKIKSVRMLEEISEKFGDDNADN